MTDVIRALLRGLVASLSIAVGYLPIAFSFGLAAVEAGLSPNATLLISAAVFAGASQFLLIALLVSGAAWWTAVPTVLLMNARHLFYGPALVNRLPARTAPLPAPLLAFGLTDEVFATALSKVDRVPAAERETWLVGLQLGAYSAWLLGTWLGTRLSGRIDLLPDFARDALGFVLPALFLSLLLEIGVARWKTPILVAAASAAVLLAVLPAHHALALGIVAGALAHAIARPRA